MFPLLHVADLCRMIVCARFTDTAAAVDVNGYPGLIYFIIFLYLSSYQIFRLFVAIIAQSFELDDSEKLDAQVGCFRLPYSQPDNYGILISLCQINQTVKELTFRVDRKSSWMLSSRTKRLGFLILASRDYYARLRFVLIRSKLKERPESPSGTRRRNTLISRSIHTSEIL